jgi:hypothetical protein
MQVLAQVDYGALEVEREIARRQGLLGSLFLEQRAAMQDPCRRVYIETTRRSGKSRGSLQALIEDGLRHPGAAYGYSALTEDSVQDIAWEQILYEIDRTHRIGLLYREHKLTVVLPGGAYIRFFGADTPSWARRIHGTKWRKFVIDEGAHYRVNVRHLAEGAVFPALKDMQGQLIITTTPDYVRRGYAWEISRELPEYMRRGMGGHGFSVHRWTAAENPHIREQYLADLAYLRSINPDIDRDPLFIANELGRWPSESTLRVFSFERPRNELHDFDVDAAAKAGAKFLCVVDFGWTHHSAYTVLTWGPQSPDLVALRAWKAPKLTLDKMQEQLEPLRAIYPRLQFTADPKHRQLLETLAARMGLWIEAAQKSDQEDTILLINTDLTLGRIKLLRPDHETCPLAEELTSLCKIEATDGTYRLPKVGDDCADCLTYGFRESYHYRYAPKEAMPSPGSVAAVRAEAELLKTARFKTLKGQRAQCRWWEH